MTLGFPGASSPSGFFASDVGLADVGRQLRRASDGGRGVDGLVTAFALELGLIGDQRGDDAEDALVVLVEGQLLTEPRLIGRADGREPHDGRLPPLRAHDRLR